MPERLRRIGSIRPSLNNQHPSLQADALKQVGYTKRYEVNSNVLEPLNERLDMPGNGDTLLIYRLDRLARDEYRIINFQLDAMGVTLETADDQRTNGGSDAE